MKSTQNYEQWPLNLYPSIGFNGKWEMSHLLGTEALLSSQISCRRAAILDRKPLGLLLDLLLLCGDVNLNPGPNWKFPCGICSKPVKSNQMGIQCDQCDAWLHTNCLDMNFGDYETLANSSCSWICPNCEVRLLRYIDIPKIIGFL